MLIEQTHFPGGPNWGKRIIISLVCIAAVVIAYKVLVPPKIVTKSKSDQDKKPDNDGMIK